MTRHAVVLYALLLVVSTTAVVGLVFWQRDHRRATELSTLRDEVCQRMETDLASTLTKVTADRSNAAKLELHVTIPARHLNEGLMLLCFGKPSVVDTVAADTCWVMSDRRDDACYIDVAQRLLDAYRARRR